MAIRKIIDAKHNGEKVWLKGHAQATYMSNGSTVEDAINSLQESSGEAVPETDPVFLASPAASITEANKQAWNNKQDAISDLTNIRNGAAKGATAVQPSSLAKVATSGSYNDLSNKPTIPSAINIAGTNYTPADSGIIDLNLAGLYRKPSTGIPNSDLSEELREKLETAHRNAEAYRGTVTNITINGVTKSAADGVIDLGYFPTSIPSEVYITDFDALSLESLVQNDIQRLELDKQGLMDALARHKVILVPYEIADNTSLKGYCTLVGYYEDLLYIKVITEYSEIIIDTSLDTQYISSGEITKRDWFGKQDTLVSGENIKTINGESILGDGDITIEGGGGTITGVSANGTSIATSGVANIPAATTSKYGVTKLTTLTNSSSTTLAATASAVKAAYDLANGKQDKLVSGTNIKTINGTSILGSGNIVISGGGDYLPLTGGTITGDLTLTGTGNFIAYSVGAAEFYSDIYYLNRNGAHGVRMGDDKVEIIDEFERTKSSIDWSGDGTKFLSDDGTYKTISSGGGSSSGGNSAYSEVNHGTSDTTFTLTPNTFHVWDEVTSLTLDLGSETSGVANEYLFQFNSGATATTLTLPSDLKWTEELNIEANKIYQVSILKGMASVLEFSNAAPVVLITFYYSGSPYSAEEGMTWAQWCNSAYNNTTLKISGGVLTVNGMYPIYNSSGMSVYGTDVIIENEYYMYNVDSN